MMENKPLPQYASTRCVGVSFERCPGEAEKIAFLT